MGGVLEVTSRELKIFQRGTVMDYWIDCEFFKGRD